MASEELKQVIGNLEELTNSAVVQTSTDGTSTTFDLEFAAKRLNQLKPLDPQAAMRGEVVHPMMDVRLG